jgi:hypothetical protein
MADGDDKKHEELKKLLVGNNQEKSFATKMSEEATVTFKTLSKSIQENYNAQVELNRSFGQGQERLVEMQKAISDAVPKVTRLGGSITDVQTAMSEIALASNRNVVSNSKDVEKLYAATKLIDESAGSLTNSFLDIGVGVSEIPKQLESSINYIQSIGGNTRKVMKDVTANMDQMNRYQFEGGVAGLTKMAAQASMLRFNMSDTFALAEKVLDPEGAIETAAAFQRLGVSAGNLTDPFQLMNLSINDPSGLQTSLADVSKQFTYFDDKTKTFKINPQGVLTLKEMEKSAGLSAGSLSKMGLAAAELDQRISAINMAGLTIGSEEDKQYLANIANMEDGTYKVSLEDGTKKELSELSQPEFDKLIKEQKTGPKTLEEIAKSQLKIDESMLLDVRSIRESFVKGIVSSKQIGKGIAGAQRVGKAVFGEASSAINAKDFRNISEELITNLGIVATDLKQGNKPLTDVLSNSLNRAADTFDEARKNFSEIFKGYKQKVSEKITNQTVGESMLKNIISEDIKPSVSNSKVSTTPLNPSGVNNTSTLQNNQPSSTTTTNQTNQTIDVGGKIVVDITAPAGINTQQLQQIFTDTFNSNSFVNHIVGITSSKTLKEPMSKTYA